jgi:hypothetical protein
MYVPASLRSNEPSDNVASSTAKVKLPAFVQLNKQTGKQSPEMLMSFITSSSFSIYLDVGGNNMTELASGPSMQRNTLIFILNHMTIVKVPQYSELNMSIAGHLHIK